MPRITLAGVGNRPLRGGSTASLELLIKTMDNEQIHDLYKKTLLNRKYSDRTIKAYISWVYDLKNYFSNGQLHVLQVDSLNEYIEHLSSTRKLSIASLRQARNALNFLYNRILNKHFVLTGYPKKWHDGPEIDVPSQEEIFSIIENVENENNRLAISLLYSTGVDLNELLNTRIRNVDIVNEVISVPMNRKGGFRKVIIPKALSKKLDLHCSGKSKDSYLFSNRTNSKYHPTTIQKAFKKSLTTAGIRGEYNIRSLRYAYIKHLELLGVPVNSTIKNMNLSKSSSIKFYSRIGVKEVPVVFSPIDRKIPNNKKKNKSLEPYISEDRLKQISTISTNKFDLTRLIELLHELNIAHANNSYMSISMLVRAIIDHVPPIFDCDSFKEVCNNYKSSKSFKSSMSHLNNSLRNVADTFLHLRVRYKEALPTFSQVDFRSDIDVLLSEIVRIHKDMGSGLEP